MWLLPTLSRLSRLAAHGFYRLTLTGDTVPAEGPVLLVANHPNSLVDPLFVACAAGRPVRFLAKAPLFDHPTVGFLVRGSGAIPVHRRKDDPGRMEQNEDTFRAAYDALARGSAVALFPEGMSHSEPSLQPLKTGAARIALGAREAGGPPFPIIPIGIVLRARETFRSEALIIVGQPIEWEDLGRLGVEDRKAVHQLTDRIDEALRGVTFNLERWEDEPLVSTAEAVWAAAADAVCISVAEETIGIKEGQCHGPSGPEASSSEIATPDTGAGVPATPKPEPAGPPSSTSPDPAVPGPILP